MNLGMGRLAASCFAAFAMLLAAAMLALMPGVAAAQPEAVSDAASCIGEPLTLGGGSSASQDEGEEAAPPASYSDSVGSSHGYAEHDEPLAYAGSLTRSGDWEYRTTDEYGGTTAIITDYFGDDVDLVLPSSIDGYPVSNIQTYGEDFVERIETLTVPSSMKAIGSRSFMGAANLKSVVFEPGCQVETFGEHCFEGCLSLTEFTMPESLRVCDDSPFYGCVNLKKLVFSDDLEPFLYLSRVVSGNDRFVVERHFNPAPYAENVEFVVSSSSKNYKVVDGSLLSKDGTILYAHPSAPANGAFVVPDTVKVMGWYCLFSNEDITHIELPSGLERIEEYAMAYTGIDELIMPDSVTEVQEGICYKCPNLKKVVIGDSLKELGQQAGWNCFYECRNLEEVILGSSLEVIGNGTFAYSKIESIHLPDSVKQINYAAFAECTRLSSITGGKGLERLYRMSFANNDSLTSFPLEASDGYRFISKEAFSGTPYQLKRPDYMTVSDGGDFVVYDASLVFEGEVKYSEAFKALDLVNEERAKQGLSKLSMDEDLMRAAVQRAAELSVYFDHTRPTGDDCFTVSDEASAENIAAFQSTAEGVMESWMDSAGHRSNILGSEWKSIGVAAFKQNGLTYWVQLFGVEEPSIAVQPSDRVEEIVVDVIDGECPLDIQILYVDIEGGGNIQDEGLDVGEQGRVGVAVLQDLVGRSTFSRVSDSCIAWSSSNPDVASIDYMGVVTARSAGTATMTAKIDSTSGYYVRTYDVTVKNSKLAGKVTLAGDPCTGKALRANAVFDGACSDSSPVYQWFDTGTDQPVGEASKEATLTIGEGMLGRSYYCVVTDGSGKHLGSIKSESVLSAHSFGEWAMIRQPTSDMAGLRERSCSVCGCVEREEVSKLPFSNPFIDVFEEGTPHYTHILWLAEEGISEGWLDEASGVRAYRPWSSVARADMAAFLYRLAGSPAFEPSAADLAAFSDVDEGTPHYKEVLWLASAGISEGWDAGGGARVFRPYDEIARIDMAAFLHRLAGWMEAPEPEGAGKAFPDVASGMPHAEDVAWLASAGITTGFPDGEFKPYGSIVRCDMAAMLHRLDGLAKGYEVA